MGEQVENRTKGHTRRPHETDGSFLRCKYNSALPSRKKEEAWNQTV